MLRLSLLDYRHSTSSITSLSSTHIPHPLTNPPAHILPPPPHQQSSKHSTLPQSHSSYPSQRGHGSSASSLIPSSPPLVPPAMPLLPNSCMEMEMANPSLMHQRRNSSSADNLQRLPWASGGRLNSMVSADPLAGRCKARWVHLLQQWALAWGRWQVAAAAQGRRGKVLTAIGGAPTVATSTSYSGCSATDAPRLSPRLKFLRQGKSS